MVPLVLLKAAEDRDVVVPTRPGWRERVTARVRANRLDTELARGAPPTHVALALRAQDLGERRTRQRLSRSVRRILDDARTDRPLSLARVPTQRREVLVAARELERIAETLLTPGPVAASGVAQVRLLLIDGAGPLYSRDAPGALRVAATRALDALEPAFQW
ncbi:MAG TPA: hypothetical protein VHZ27_20600 [Solirubrobacteraceae bacterium]|jgi:hypothetical protein|nr:hypothetical protein [Solirubrobacteraceae bacterium]